VPSAQNGGLPVKLAHFFIKKSLLWTPLARRKALNLVRAMESTHFCAKSAKNDLKPTDFLKKRNFYFETEGVLLSSPALANSNLVSLATGYNAQVNPTLITFFCY
jgi:hypothetical protein